MKGQRTKGKYGIPTNKTLKQTPGDIDRYDHISNFLVTENALKVHESQYNRLRNLCYQCIQDKKAAKKAFEQQLMREKLKA